MFAGIVQNVGKVARVDDTGAERRLVVRTGLAPRLAVGESLAVDGVCLTVERSGKREVVVTAVAETLARTTLGRLQPGSRVNLETALRLGDPVGGHLVQGHVECVGRVARVQARGESIEMDVEAPDAVRYLIEKGSVAVDGVSLTVARLLDAGFGVALIPHTLAATVLGERRPGDPVNIETDLIAKYVERLLAPRAPEGRRGITLAFLREHGYA